MDAKKPLLYIERNYILADLKQGQISVKIETGLEPCQVDGFKFVELLESAEGALSFTQSESTLSLTSNSGTVTILSYPIEEKIAHKITLESIAQLNHTALLNELENAFNFLKIAKEACLQFIGDSVICGNKSNVYFSKNETNIEKLLIQPLEIDFLKKFIKANKGYEFLKFSRSDSYLTLWGAESYLTLFIDNQNRTLDLKKLKAYIPKEFQTLPSDFFKKLKTVKTITEEEVITLHSNTVQGSSGEIFAAFNLKVQFSDSSFLLKQLIACEKFKPLSFEIFKGVFVFKTEKPSFVFIAALQVNKVAEEIEKAGSEFNVNF